MAIGVAIFFPFVFWKGGNQQPDVNEGGYPIRPSSKHRAEVARMQQEQQQAYQQQYPGSTTGSYPSAQMYQQNPNVIVTGKFVTD